MNHLDNINTPIQNYVNLTSKIISFHSWIDRNNLYAIMPYNGYKVRLLPFPSLISLFSLVHCWFDAFGGVVFNRTKPSRIQITYCIGPIYFFVSSLFVFFFSFFLRQSHDQYAIYALHIRCTVCTHRKWIINEHRKCLHSI